MINAYTKAQMMSASRQANELANKELVKALVGLVVSLGGLAYGVMHGMDFAYLKANGETYRKIGVDSLNILED